MEEQKLYTCQKMCQYNDYVCQRSIRDAITYQFITMPSMPVVPRPLLVSQFNTVLRSFSAYTSELRVQYSLIQGNELGYFEVKSDRNSGESHYFNSELVTLIFTLLIRNHFITKVTIEIIRITKKTPPRVLLFYVDRFFNGPYNLKAKYGVNIYDNRTAYRF